MFFLTKYDTTLRWKKIDKLDIRKKNYDIEIINCARVAYDNV